MVSLLFSLMRKIAPVGCVATAFLSLALPAHADDAAEAFVSGILAEANPIFEAETDEERLTGIETLVEKYVDMRRVGMFVLGQYGRVITAEQKAEYLPLFQKYATLVYQDSLSNYSGQRLEVTGSVDRTDSDIIVNSKIVDAAPGDQYADLVVHWRVYRSPKGEMSIFDAGAEGIWLAIEQQSQFKSVIANNGGGNRGIDALIDNLRAKIGE